MKKKVLIIGSGLELNSVAEKLRLDHKEVEVVDDINEANDVLIGKITPKEIVHQFTNPKLHNHFAGDLTKRQLSAPDAEPVRSTPKIQNNDPCPCGSGKKYKKCCK